MGKSADAFRTISEVAEWLDTPAHVLRFWESKFTQVKPVKRAGGRRYYRPADMRLLGGIKKLLHEDGMTIKGAQKILREQGVKHVSSLCTLSVGEEDEMEDVTLEEVVASEPVDTVVPFAKPADVAPDQPAESVAVESVEEDTPPIIEEEPAADTAFVEDASQAEPEADTAADADVEVTADAPAPAQEEAAADPVPELPGFLQKSMDDRLDDADAPTEADAVADTPLPEAAPEPAPVPHMTLTHLSRIDRIPPELAAQIAPLAERLRAIAG